MENKKTICKLELTVSVLDNGKLSMLIYDEDTLARTECLNLDPESAGKRLEWEISSRMPYSKERILVYFWYHHNAISDADMEAISNCIRRSDFSEFRKWQEKLNSNPEGIVFLPNTAWDAVTGKDVSIMSEEAFKSITKQLRIDPNPFETERKGNGQ